MPQLQRQCLQRSHSKAQQRMGHRPSERLSGVQAAERLVRRSQSAAAAAALLEMPAKRNATIAMIQLSDQFDAPATARVIAMFQRR
jgi:hypothetical protein